MSRSKRIIINNVIEDQVVDNYKSMDLEQINRQRQEKEQVLNNSINEINQIAQEIYKEKPSKADIEREHKIYSVKSAYEYLKRKGIDISFRAFGGRIERGVVSYVKVGRKRFIPQSILDDIVNIKGEFYTVREAYTEYKKSNNKINLRAFIGRIEKGSVPSVKFGTRRLIPKDAIDALTHISNDYYPVSEAVQELHSNNVTIKRNAFERRLDRGRIPHVKVAGRRFIHEDILQELVDKEIALKTDVNKVSALAPQ